MNVIKKITALAVALVLALSAITVWAEDGQEQAFDAALGESAIPGIQDGPTASAAAGTEDTAIIFQDINFERAVLRILGKTAGPVFVSEIQSLTYLDLYGQNIENLSGIEHFTGLKFLECSGNRMTVLDLSGNNALEILFCNNNRLTSLDLTGSASLSYLECSQNQLDSLDLSGNPLLSGFNCENNRITSLELENHPLLGSFNCGRNRLAALDVAGCPALGELYCDYNDLASLELSGNAALYVVSCASNLLTSLSLCEQASYQVVDCRYNYLPSRVSITDTFSVGRLLFDPQRAAVTGISVAAPPMKTDYNPGEALNLYGMAINAGYSDGSVRNITASVTTNPKNGSLLGGPGVKTINVSYTDGDGVVWETEFTVTVKEPSIGTLTIQPGSIVQGQEAYIWALYSTPVMYADFAMLDKNGDIIGGTVKGSNGIAVIPVTVPDEPGTYSVVALMYGEVRARGSIEVIPYNPDIWTAYTTVDKDGFVVINFNEAIAAKDGRFDDEASLDGKQISVKLSGSRSLVTNVKYAELPAGVNTFTITTVKYPKLYPSYSFTFTAAVEKV